MMGFPNEKQIAYIKKCYPVGTRVELISMNDPFSKLGMGDQGTIRYIDDAGQIHVEWDCGSTLALIPGVDSFKCI